MGSYIKMMMRERALSLVMVIFLLLVGVITTLIAMLFFMFGTAHELSAALAVDIWLGYVITGLIFLIPIFSFILLISLRTNLRMSRKKAEGVRAANELSHTIIEVADIEKWVQKHPYSFIGSAAALGFGLSGALFPATPKENGVARPSSPEAHAGSAQDPISTMMAVVLEEVVREVAIPYLKQQIKTHQTDNEHAV